MEQINQITGTKKLSDLAINLELDPILKDLWNNKKDSAYDKLPINEARS